jgi:hypothetical protein
MGLGFVATTTAPGHRHNGYSERAGEAAREVVELARRQRWAAVQASPGAVAEIMRAARVPMPLEIGASERWCPNCGESTGEPFCRRCGCRRMVPPASVLRDGEYTVR